MTDPAGRSLAPRPLRTALPVLLVTMVLGSCAPHRAAGPGTLDLADARARSRRFLATRPDPDRVVEAEITVWMRFHPGRRLPGGSGRVRLQPPDGVRLRIASLFGTAFEFAAHGDSIAAVIPAERLGVAADAARDSLGVSLPGALAYRLLSGAWVPPDSALWARDQETTRWTALWSEAEDRVRVWLAADGRPERAEWASAGGAWRAEYLEWAREGGAAWPALVRCTDPLGRLSVTARLARTRSRARVGDAPLAVRFAPGTEMLDWRSFRDTLERADGWLR